MATKGQQFLEMYGKVTEFTKELMEENSRLKSRVNDLIADRESFLSDGMQDPEESSLVRKLEELKREKQDIINQYRQIEEENKDFLNRYEEIAFENSNLANLYVASYQLHSSLDLNEVLQIISEIVINLIGAQNFGILMLNEKRGMLEPIRAVGLPIEALSEVKMGEGIIGSGAESGEVYYRKSFDRNAPLDVHHPMVCVPLKIKDEVIGVIVVYALLPQKEKLLKVDYDLFGLLAAHAATAIFSAKLYGDSIRKQKTIKGFLDLVTH